MWRCDPPEASSGVRLIPLRQPCKQRAAKTETNGAAGRPGSDVQEQLDLVEAELEEVDLRIAELQRKKAELDSRRDALLRRLGDACAAAGPSPSSSSRASRPEPVLSKQELQRFDGTGTVNPQLDRKLSAEVERGGGSPLFVWLLFGRFSMVQGGGAASEGHVWSAEVQTAAAAGCQPDAVRQGSLSGHAHGKRKKPLLPAAGALL